MFVRVVWGYQSSAKIRRDPTCLPLHWVQGCLTAGMSCFSSFDRAAQRGVIVKTWPGRGVRFVCEESGWRNEHGNPCRVVDLG